MTSELEKKKLEKTLDQKEEVVEKILETFNLTRLCPKCDGPLEWNNEIHCDKCKLIIDIQQILVTLELGVMKLRDRIGLSAKQLKQLSTLDVTSNRPPIVGGDPNDEIPNHIGE